MADIHINYNSYGNEKDTSIKETVEIFREVADRNLKEIEGVFLFEYINQHNQFDVMDFPEIGDTIYPKFIKIDNEIPNCFIAGLKYYRNI